MEKLLLEDSLHSNLEQYRIIKNITYREFGKRVGLDWRTLYRILTGAVTRPHARTAYCIGQFVKQNKQEIIDTLNEQ